MRRAIIDTGAVYAIADRSDQHHAAAAAFLRRWLKAGHIFVLADWVFGEALTLLKRRLGPAALRVGQELRRNPVYQWAPISLDDEQAAWAIFQKYADKEWSYVDCGLLALSRRLNVREVFAFDDHFDQMPNLTRLPK